MLNLHKLSPRSFDWQLFTGVFFLVLIGMSAIYSVDLSRGSELFFFKKQLIALGVGLLFLFVASTSQHTLWRYLAKWWYLFSLLLLVAVLIFGQSIRGTKGWFSVFGFSFQPVEMAKIGLILMIAYIISRFGRRFDKALFFFGTGIVTLLLLGLTMMQPDLGSAVLLGVIWFGMVWAAGARRLYLILLTASVIFFVVMGWFFFLKDYQKDRLANFIDPGRDPLGSGYNVTQSIIAVGAGKIFGRGLGFGSQSQLRFLPEAQTDFIFSVIGEELGLAGVATMLVLFALVFWRLLLIIAKSDDDFVAATATGILILFFAQLITNLGANLGLLPITGVTLPFVSYGGSSLVINLLLVGILESMMVKRY
ncbi:MAG: Rod shape-determining protein RodA [Candidatus Magasanikbacteria bacterium GW2011_GWA2_40_10]|uniref:Rod shape-determining protein RodA n=1 Tax=Candidatus Magasanikbacteria bacterium GW2011_GWA2_40_10 TaxID=1619037 RepID=A0A0G0SJV2_9BACT|nr:MAG: Rod shape-determining protein RodA [Candidatus Magasanikbacteria bacterium GW2011_GWA2_40_10]